MKKVFGVILVLCMLMSVGCANNNSIGIIGGADGPTSIFVNERNAVDYFTERYVNERKLPVFDLDIDREVRAGDRVLILDDTIENELEYIIYEMYRNETEGTYDKIFEGIADETLLIAKKNEEANFNEGIYLTRVFIDDIDLLDKDDLKDITEGARMNAEEHLKQYNAEEFAIVEVEKEIKHNEKSLSRAPQTGDGEVKRYYLLAKKDGKYKILDVYWADFMTD